MKKVKVQNLKFRILDGIARFIYEVRESHLVRLNDWIDYLASKEYKENLNPNDLEKLKNF